MKQLAESDIEEGVLIWYEGFTSRFSWSCPAVITQVCHKNRTFCVRSLDDMCEQTQEYSFGVGLCSPSASRKSMRLASVEEVEEYLNQRARELSDEVDFEESEETGRAKRCFQEFQEGRKQLELTV